MRQFQKVVTDHYRAHGRKLPWRATRNTYRIFVSEIMLQQTQVDRVIPKYKLFLKRFPSWRSLASAKTADVLGAWQGLGYNRRAIFLKHASELITKKYGGKLPRTIGELRMIPGVGTYTAGALMAFVYNAPAIFIETNIRRAFIHYFFPKRRAVHDRKILPLIAATMKRKNPREWYYALMDYGAMLAKKGSNPNRKSAHYTKQSPFAGSLRQSRGGIVRLLIANPAGLPKAKIIKSLAAPAPKIDQAIDGLLRDGLVKRSGTRFRLTS